MQKDSPRKAGSNTLEGKATISKNSTKHGLTGNRAKLLPGETEADYNSIRDMWMAEYDSESAGAARLLEPLINNDRMVRYASAAVVDVQIALSHAEAASAQDQDLIERLHKDLQNKLNYKTQHERSFQSALRNIEQFGQRRVREANAVRHLEVVEHKAAFETSIKCHEAGIDVKIFLPVQTSVSPHIPKDKNQENPPV